MATDFSGFLQSSQALYVSDVIHKARIRINENDTVASAATGNFIQINYFQNVLT